jgi:hypothetical protein
MYRRLEGGLQQKLHCSKSRQRHWPVVFTAELAAAEGKWRQSRGGGKTWVAREEGCTGMYRGKSSLPCTGWSRYAE